MFWLHLHVPLSPPAFLFVQGSWPVLLHQKGCSSEFQLGSDSEKLHYDTVESKEMKLEYLFLWLPSCEVASGFWLQFLTEITLTSRMLTQSDFLSSWLLWFLIGYDIQLLIGAAFSSPLGLGMIIICYHQPQVTAVFLWFPQNYTFVNVKIILSPLTLSYVVRDKLFLLKMW